MTWIAVALGGLLGSVARHGVNVLFARSLARPAPYATATVNLIGSFAIGALAGSLASGRLTMTVPMRAFVFVGILGGFTTFSSFMLDNLTLADAGIPAQAVANVLAQTIIGFAAIYAAYRAFS